MHITHGLCHLQALTVGEGCFDDLNTPQHLTKLQGQYAYVNCSRPCEFLDALRHLHVCQGSLSSFIDGVGACRDQHLGCVFGLIESQAGEASHQLDEEWLADFLGSMNSWSGLGELESCEMWN